jgi:hypothetical protein
MKGVAAMIASGRKLQIASWNSECSLHYILSVNAQLLTLLSSRRIETTVAAINNNPFE